jgi:hypothetical protein
VVAHVCQRLAGVLRGTCLVLPEDAGAVTIFFKSCPRCNGDVELRPERAEGFSRAYGAGPRYEVRCIQCGYSGGTREPEGRELSARHRVGVGLHERAMRSGVHVATL